MARLVPRSVFRAHWKGLSDYRQRKTRPDHFTRAAMLLTPAGCAAAVFIWDLVIPGAADLLAAVALLAGGFLAAFTHLSSLRLRLEERKAQWRQVEQFDRDGIDETSAHLLVGAYISGLLIPVLIIGGMFKDEDTDGLTGAWGALAAAGLSYLCLIFLISIPRLYSSYVGFANVRDELNGTHKDKR